MKKIIFLFVALAAMMFASCRKEQTGGEEAVKPARLTIKIAGTPGTRLTEPPASTDPGTIQITGGHIFVISPTDEVTDSEPLQPALAWGDSAPGQVLADDVPGDSRIYIVCNIPAGSDVASQTSLANIKVLEAAMTSQTDYTTVALANVDGEPVLIDVDDSVTPDIDNQATVEATVTVQVNPLISRVELGKVTGGPKITSFTVAGVYVDDWYPNFTYGGLFGGTKYEQHQSTAFDGNALKNEGSWIAIEDVPGTPPLYATPTTPGNVWAYNVAAGGLPRLLIAIDNLKFMYDDDDDSGTPDIEMTETERVYLTVTGYEVGGNSLPAFERGKIYSIGGGVSGDGIVFNPDDPGFTPNPEGVTLRVFVTVKEWELVATDALL